MRRLVDQKAHGSKLGISVLACSKGAEVYSIVCTIHSACPDLRFNMYAVDISKEILEFAERGVYSLTGLDVLEAPNHEGITERGHVTWNTCRDQDATIFERMINEEVEAMFEVEGDQAKVRPSVIELDVRTRAAREIRLKPVTAL